MPLGAHKAAIMGVAGTAAAGDVVLILSQTATDDSELDFSSGIDSTYGEYIFRFYNINPATDAGNLSFQVNVAGETDYDETMTTTQFYARHYESDAYTGIFYNDTNDKAQDTGFQIIADGQGSAADEGTSGELHLFNPSSTTYVKHFYSTLNVYHVAPQLVNFFTAGYVNVTGAIDDIRFKMASGNFDGTIKMWGVK